MSMSQVAATALLGLFNAGATAVFMTAEEGNELASLGYIGVDANQRSPLNNNAFRVMITEAGVNALNSSAPAAPAFPTMMAPPSIPVAPVAPVAAPAAPKVKPTFSIASNIPVPTIQRGSGLVPRETIYPFNELEINQSFHVPATEENPTPHKTMASNVSAANKRSEVDYLDPTTGQPVPVQVTKKTLQKDAEGNAIKDASGKKVYTQSTIVENKKVATKKFVARRVDATDPNGPGVRVFRVSL